MLIKKQLNQHPNIINFVKDLSRWKEDLILRVVTNHFSGNEQLTNLIGSPDFLNKVMKSLYNKKNLKYINIVIEEIMSAEIIEYTGEYFPSDSTIFMWQQEDLSCQLRLIHEDLCLIRYQIYLYQLPFQPIYFIKLIGILNFLNYVN